MSNSQLAAIERTIKVAREDIEFAKAVARLQDNKDFKNVIGEGYFKREAIRLVHLRGDPAVQGVDQQKSINSQMDSIGAFHQYLLMVQRRGAQAQQQMEADESTREDLLAEDLNNGS